MSFESERQKGLAQAASAGREGQRYLDAGAADHRAHMASLQEKHDNAPGESAYDRNLGATRATFNPRTGKTK